MAATKKAPTRKQLIARRKFVVMVKARAKLAATAKRKAGYKLKAGKWVAPKVVPKRRNLSFFAKQTSSASKGQGQWGVYKRKKSGGTKRTGGRTGYFMDEKSARRAAAKKVLKRRVKTSNPLSVTKNGRKLYGAAAAAVLAKRGGAKKRGTLLANRKRNGMFSRAAKAAISKRLTQPIRFGRKRRNGSTPPAINDVHKMFLGRPSTKAFQVKAPDGTPADVAVLGPLVCLKTRDEDFIFAKGEAWIATDGKAQKLYILGDKYAHGLEPNANFGHITEIRYEARKDHINPFRWRRRARNSQVTEYFHFFGEEDGRKPRLESDRDRLLHISGGNYKIKSEGIIN